MMPKEFDLTGKVSVVIGGGRGIGSAIALALAEAGCDVLVSARTQEQIDQTASGVRQFGRKSIAMRADATNPDDMDKVAAAAVSELGKIDIWVNSQGVGVRKPVVPLPGYKPGWSAFIKDFDLRTGDEEWRFCMDANLSTIFYATRAAAPQMIKQGKGKIINLSSYTAAKGLPFQALYCTTKAAVAMFTRCLAAEWARYKINVNAIAPGYVATEMTSLMFSDKNFADKLLAAVPMGRICQPREVALLAVYLASEASDYMTGQTIYLDGGMTV